VSHDDEVPAGTVLCREGEIGREFFVIVDGEAAVTRRGRRLVTQRAGDFFGEIALLENVHRTATVTARTPLRFFADRRELSAAARRGSPSRAQGAAGAREAVSWLSHATDTGLIDQTATAGGPQAASRPPGR
jgi:potassium-dependent mechanosensitive channel